MKVALLWAGKDKPYALGIAGGFKYSYSVEQIFVFR